MPPDLDQVEFVLRKHLPLKLGDDGPVICICSMATTYVGPVAQRLHVAKKLQEAGLLQDPPPPSPSEPVFFSFGEAYMDGNADAFGEVHGYLIGAAIGVKDDAVRQELFRVAEYVLSRQRDCDKSRWELRDAARATDTDPA